MNPPSLTTSGGPPSQEDGGSSTFVLAHPRKISPNTAPGRKRHHYSNDGNRNNHKRRKVDAMDVDPVFPKLDQSNPQHAKRIQTRRRTVQMGKNTPGYAEYMRQVPLHERRPRSMETPSTPDHTLDIPNKRWMGLVKAWRIALHKYDPPDLASAFEQGDPQQQQQAGDLDNNNTTANNNHNVQSRQIEDAVARGLLVDFCGDKDSNKCNADDRDSNNGSPISVLTEESTQSGSQNLMDLEEWNDVAATNTGGSNDDLEADSDDELL